MEWYITDDKQPTTSGYYRAEWEDMIGHLWFDAKSRTWGKEPGTHPWRWAHCTEARHV